jgi:hypothetical protein
MVPAESDREPSSNVNLRGASAASKLLRIEVADFQPGVVASTHRAASTGMTDFEIQRRAEARASSRF